MLADAKRFLDRPSALYATESRCVVDAKAGAPILKAHGFPVMSEVDGVAPVSYLFSPARPLAVLLGVAKIVVDALKRKSLWHVAHVRIENIERLPGLAVAYAALTIVGVCRVCWIGATLFHGLPGLICPCSRLAMACSLFVFNAPARADAALGKMIAANRGSIPALADAFPIGSFVAGGLPNDSKS